MEATGSPSRRTPTGVMDAHRSGGHVTLVFSIHDLDPRPLWQGSRGLGLCLQAGVEVKARVGSGPDGLMTIRLAELTGAKVECSAFADADPNAVEEVMRPFLALWQSLPEGCRPRAAVELDIRLELPRAQGFGMSAAGLLAGAQALLGLRDASGLQGVRAMNAAHVAERSISSGLGDVVGLCAGGLETRHAAGVPQRVESDTLVQGPGRVSGRDLGLPLVVAWDPALPRLTTTFIDDPIWRSRITSTGERALNRLDHGSDDATFWEAVLTAAHDFADALGMWQDEGVVRLRREVDRVLREEGLDESWTSRLCMLGTSLAIMPRTLGSPEDRRTLKADASAIAHALVAAGQPARATWLAGPLAFATPSIEPATTALAA